MANKRIKYFCFHGDHSHGENRNNSPAADSKVDYIVSALNQCGYEVDIISRQVTDNFFSLGGKRKDGQNTIRFFVNFGVLRRLTGWITNLAFFVWCLFNIKRNETVIIYHSLGYSSVFLRLRKIIEFRIIGEIEEIYHDVSLKSSDFICNENKFIKLCDAYIIPTVLLNDKINPTNKPFCVIHGIYSVTTKHIFNKKDDFIHVIYAGTLDPDKGGADAAIKSAEYLPCNYHVHICGFGSNDIIEKTKAHCESISRKGGAMVSYDGIYSGVEFEKKLQQNSIGLSTQNPNAAFNDTSFPSKILVYLSNGLKVVTVRIPVVETSDVNTAVSYYDQQSPSEIAKAIEKATTMIVNSPSELLSSLDRKFCNNINKLVKNI